MPDLEFDRIGKYRILAKIGQGAMGEVFRAHDPVLNREVAIKTISAGTDADDTLRKRFEREAQSAARLNHPNIITVFDFGEEHGRMYMAMELLEGNDLKDLITRRVLSEVHDKLDIMEQICDGLAYAHAKDVVHRDLKPGNIHVQPSGQVKIMDFGLARLGSSDMTRDGLILGTPNYMSPEQVRGEKADTRSDIFSLGAVFYELLANRKPFDADSLHAVLFNVLQQEPEPVRHWVPELPPDLVDLVERALAKDATERFQNAAEMREALRVVRKALAEGWVGESTVAMNGDSPLAALSPPEAPPPTPPASRSGVRSGVRSGLRSAVRPPSAAPAAAVARDLSKAETLGREGSGSRPGVTLSGRAATTPGQPSPLASMAAPVATASRWPLYAGGVLALAAAGAVGVVLARRPAASTPPTTADGKVTALTQALVGSQVELARRSLQDKDYRGAQSQAQGVLQLDPANASAKAVLDEAQRSLEQIESSATEARAAYDAGDADRASRALARVLALDPRHPVAAELSQRLGGRFRGEAEEARRALGRSRSGAERARGTSLPAFAEAEGLGRDGEALFRKGDFAAAAQKFLASRDAFERARRDAEERAARAAAPVPTPPPPTAPATTVAALPPPTHAAPPTLPPVTAAPVTQPPVTSPPVTAASDDTLVRRVVADYGRAIENRDLALFRALKPNLSADEERRLQEAFRGIESQRVEIDVVSLRVDGGRATVKVKRRDTINGHGVAPFQQTLTLVRGPAGWTIQEIGR